MTTKTLRRVRFNPSDYAVEPKVKTLKEHPGKVEREFKLPYYRRMAMTVYISLFQGRYNRTPFKVFIQRQITNTTPVYRGKKNSSLQRYVKTFDDITNFLLNCREENNSVNHMRDLFRDYFNVILNHYGHYHRIPNLNQLGPGPVNSENFHQYSTQEELFGMGYWMEQKHIDGAKKWEDPDRPDNMDDPWIDKGRLQMGLLPIYRSYRKLSPNGEIMEHGVEKIYSPVGKLLETRSI